MKPFVLGDTVTVNRVLSRTTEERPATNEFNGRTYSQHWRVWKPIAHPTVVGIVIGTRTLMNIERVLVGWEEGYDNDLSSAERFEAVWVSFDLRRKPVFVLSEDAHRVEG